MTQVNFGAFSTNSSGQVVETNAGGAGIDSTALITTLMTAKNLPITNDQTQITANGKVSSALTQFQSLLSTFQSAGDALRNPPGVNNSADNVFKFTTASVSASDGTTASNYINVTTSPGATLQSYTINSIKQLATAASQSTGELDVNTADTAFVGTTPLTGGTIAAGSITFASGPAIALNANDSLNTVAAKFNAVSSQTGVGATVVQLSSGKYEISFTATNTGTNGDFDLKSGAIDSGNAVFGGASLSDAAGGQNAQFYLNGIATPIERQSNNINDVINGVTFNLTGTFNVPNSNTKALTVSVQPDTTTTQNAIVAFVNAYNAIQTFAAQQTQLNSDGTYASTALLANNQTFRQTMADLNSQITAQVSGLTGLNSLASVGITLTNQPATSTTPAVPNILTVNDGQLSSALSTNFQGVKNLFGLNVTSSNASLAVFSAPSSIGVTQFTLNLLPGANTFQATYNLGNGNVTVNLTGTPLSGGGYTLTGPQGSPIAGLQLIYASNANATITVNATQGVAAQSFNTSNSATKANTGTLAVALTSIQSQNTSLNSDITRLTTISNEYQQQLTAQFAALQSALSNVNNVLASLTANSNAQLTAALSGH